MERLLNNDVTAEQLRERLRETQEAVWEEAVRGGFDPERVRIMAVTKYVGAGAVLRAKEAGFTLIGENREQSLSEKYPSIADSGLEIHFIGRLQRNKAAKVARMVSSVQSLDSSALAKELDLQAGRLGKSLSVLLEVNIGRDPNKSGLSPEAAPEFAAQVMEYPNLCLRGLMTILPFGAPETENERYFSQMYQLFVDIQAQNRDNEEKGSFDTLSMGMSGDYRQAVRQGATMIRLGTALFV